MSRSIKVSTDESGGQSPGAYYKDGPLGRIDVMSEESLQKWETVLHMDRKTLLAAIAEFGPVVRDIRRGLLAKSEAA
jgi:hypothetical protein